MFYLPRPSITAFALAGPTTTAISSCEASRIRFTTPPAGSRRSIPWILSYAMIKKTSLTRWSRSYLNTLESIRSCLLMSSAFPVPWICWKKWIKPVLRILRCWIFVCPAFWERRLHGRFCAKARIPPMLSSWPASYWYSIRCAIIICGIDSKIKIYP